jgi:predicted DNA-binding transcriptional regulator YafY
VRALTKVTQVMPPRLRRRVEALRAMTVSPGWGGRSLAADPETLVAVAQVCRDTERLEFDYTAAGGEQTERHVEPLRLVSLGRRWYLVAYDLGRHDWRTFRLDRLRRPRGTGVRFRPRELPAEDAAAFVRSGLKQVPASYTVRALVRAPADEVRTRIGQWATVSDAEDGQCLMTMNTDWLDWPAMALGSLGAEFTVLEPPALLDYLREWSQRFGRAAEG